MQNFHRSYVKWIKNWETNKKSRMILHDMRNEDFLVKSHGLIINLPVFLHLHHRNPQLKTLLAVGGWNFGTAQLVYMTTASQSCRITLFHITTTNSSSLQYIYKLSISIGLPSWLQLLPVARHSSSLASDSWGCMALMDLTWTGSILEHGEAHQRTRRDTKCSYRLVWKSMYTC